VGREATDGRWTQVEATTGLPLSERRAPCGHYETFAGLKSSPQSGCSPDRASVLAMGQAAILVGNQTSHTAIRLYKKIVTCSGFIVYRKPL